ncbi:M16 family metallopeptidase [Parapedobacter koreensis]|uniref:Zinc protease n=1 Tax=Parapedobacter koreensis TaxID=332977 RepID=A0A1H7MTW5_9SPHI|nr:M16 family metallopeptidase [Parapedobacter koreensis]SEL14653.1 zinc protease [Parapedobacter koreensis]
MLFNQRFTYAMVASLLFLSLSQASARYRDLLPDSLRLTDTLPMDSGVVRGKLPNGLVYYIRHNEEPKDRVVMYLATKVGSILENENEKGLAHFLEHMQFNGTKHFPKNELVDYLQRAGVRFGSDLNAYTSFDETVYQLPIPSDDPELLKNGLQVMRDWAQDALLDGEEIDKERGVVLNEMLGGRGAQQRMRDQYFPMILNHSRYAERLPIGTKEIIEGFDHETLRAFHRKWYRPNLQALIVVGDIDVSAMEAQLKPLFGDLKNPVDEPVRDEYSVPLQGGNQFMAVTDPEMPQTVVQVIVKHPEAEVKTVGDYRMQLVKSLFNQMAGARFAELTRQADPPFIQGGGSIGGFLRGLDAFTMYFASKPGEIKRGFEAVVTEFERIKRHGFTSTELERAKSNFLTSVESAYAERDKRKSESYVDSYLNHFLEGENVLSNDDRYRLGKQLIGTITLEEVNALGTQYYVDSNRDVLIMAPDKDKAGLPDENTVNGWFDELKALDITAYDDNIQDEPLLEQQPQAGTVINRTERPELGTTELTLSNGVKVVLKPTDFKNDEINIAAFSPGGTALYNDTDFLSATYAATVVGGSGLGPYDATQLTKYLSGKKVSVRPYISERNEGFNASSGKKDLQTTFELIYAYFVAPRLDMEVFQGYMQRIKASLANRLDDPDAVFADTINAVLYNNNIRRTSLTVEQVDLINPQRAYDIYKARFADASDFTVTIVGSFTEPEITPLILQYLGGLPAAGRKEQAPDLGIYPPEKGLQRTVYRGKEQKSSVRLYYFGNYDYSEDENMQMDALESILNIKLIERLREAESGVYGVSASASYAKSPRYRYSFGIAYGTSPDMVEPLMVSAFEEINKIKQQGPEQTDIDKFINEQKRVLEVQLRENSFWLGHLSGSYQNNEDPAYILNYLDKLRNVTVESVKTVANKYLAEDRLFKFVLMPEVQ